MKKFLIFLLFPLIATAQFGADKLEIPVKWHISSEKTGNDTYNLIFEADIEDGWHMYSQFNDPMGSLPIVLKWKNTENNYKLIGKAKEINTHKEYNDVFRVTETFFSKKAKLIQAIKLINKDLKTVDVKLSAQVCKNECMQLKEKFTFDLSKAKSVTSTAIKKDNEKKNDKASDKNQNTEKNTQKKSTDKTQIKSNPTTDTPKNNSNNTAENNSNNNTDNNKQNITENNTNNNINEDGKYIAVPEAKKDIKEEVSEKESNSNKNSNEDKKKTPWGTFLIAFIAGLAVLFTPCIFPMIPLTISFFTKQSDKSTSGKRDAIIYALSIVAIYVAVSIPFHILKNANPGVFNNFATNTTVNLIFFTIFILFALNLFGVEKLDPVRIIPNSWVNSADKQSSKGGIFAGFFMALTLVIVSFSCTGPALGVILGNVLTGENGANLLTMAMLGFGMGIAIPFGILAFFPSLLKKLPQSGAWLNSVKVVFGFIELAFAFKFLSNADLVNDWHLINREMFIAIWISILITLAMYLFGKIRLSHDAPIENIGVFRFLLGLSSLIFAVYMLPGLWGAPLKIISGFPPPQKYSESPFGVGYTAGTTMEALPKGAEYGPNNIVVFTDYDVAMAYAKKVNKPLMLDFTGKACQNCRKMEENVWSDKKVLSKLKNDVVLVSLYVDQDTPLPKDKQHISKFSGDEIITIGDKWLEFQTYVYKDLSQPMYVIIDHEENKLNNQVHYMPDVIKYEEWLQKGIDNFNKQK